MDSVPPLIRGAIAGDTEAVEALMKEHLPGLRAFIIQRVGDLVAARESVTDVVQSTCREVLQALQDQDYENELHFRHWLYQSALRKIVDKSRYWGAARRASTKTVPLDAINDEFTMRALAGFHADDGVSSIAGRKEVLELVEQALQKLSKRHREVILMAKFMDVPHKEIAKRFEISEPAVRALLMRAMAALRAELPPAP